MRSIIVGGNVDGEETPLAKKRVVFLCSHKQQNIFSSVPVCQDGFFLSINPFAFSAFFVGREGGQLIMILVASTHGQTSYT